MKKILIVLLLAFSFKSHSQSTSRTLPVLEGAITTQSHLISFSGDCYTVWVGVFWTSGGETSLLTYGVSTIGTGCRPASNVNNSLCENMFYKDDYIQNSDTKELKYCLIDCLKDDRVYESYQVEKEKILASVKK